MKTNILKDGQKSVVDYATASQQQSRSDSRRGATRLVSCQDGSCTEASSSIKCRVNKQNNTIGTLLFLLPSLFLHNFNNLSLNHLIDLFVFKLPK